MSRPRLRFALTIGAVNNPGSCCPGLPAAASGKAGRGPMPQAAGASGQRLLVVVGALLLNGRGASACRDRGHQECVFRAKIRRFSGRGPLFGVVESAPATTYIQGILITRQQCLLMTT